MLLDEAGLRLGERSLVQEVHKSLLWLLIAALWVLPSYRMFIQTYLLWLNLEKGRMLLLRFVLTIVLFFLMGLVMECDGAFGDVSGRALLRAWFARICGSFMVLCVQVEMKIVSRANYCILCDGLMTKLPVATNLIQICR